MANICENTIPRAKTTEQYIKECTEKHGDKYDYSLVEYTDNKSYVDVTCKTHNTFTIRANNHLLGRGCPHCALLNSGLNRRVPLDLILSKSKDVHKDRYKFIGVVPHPTGLIKKLVLRCEKHGEFTQDISAHLAGKGCLLCSQDVNRYSLDEFISKAEELHGRRYDYSLVDYTVSREKVQIICNEHGHGPWWQTPALHLHGSGCPACSKTGYRTDRSGKFYVLHNGEFTKIGITNNSGNARLTQLNKGGKGFNTAFEFYFEDGNIPKQLESDLLKELRLTHKQPTEKFDGYTECFYDLDIPQLVEDIGRRLRDCPKYKSGQLSP